MKNTISVRYIDLYTGVESLEVIELRALYFFFTDESNGEIKILEVNQSFDDWETMETIYSAS